jgi:hypothetical protein
MIVDRRALLAGTALVAVTPIFRLLPLLPPSTSPNAPAFLIAGWSVEDDIDPSNQMWMRVGHGWRTAWR